jgi:hypothetical protein
MTRWRWGRDKHLNFPEPAFTINGRNYWWVDALEEWERWLASAKPTRCKLKVAVHDHPANESKEAVDLAEPANRRTPKSKAAREKRKSDS